MEHLTVQQTAAGNSIFIGTGSNFNLNVTNSILAGLTSTTGFNKGTETVTPANSTGIFTTSGAGMAYLANNTYRNLGVSTINETLREELKQLTTVAPQYMATTTISTDTVWSPQATRDTYDALDLGYHYDPLDYVITDLILTNAKLTLTNGVAVAVYGDYGFKLRSGAKLISEGSPVRMNQLIRYQLAQERSLILGANNFSRALIYCDAYPSVIPSATFRFTSISVPAHHYNGRCIVKDGGYTIAPLTLRDSHIQNGWITIQNYNDTGRISNIYLTNNIFERVAFTASNKDTIYNSRSTVFAYNNLFWRTTVSFLDNWGSYPSSPSMTIRDNIFDNFSTLLTNPHFTHCTR